MFKMIKGIFLFRYKTNLSPDECRERFTYEYRAAKKGEDIYTKNTRFWFFDTALKKSGTIKLSIWKFSVTYVYRLKFVRDGDTTIITTTHNPVNILSGIIILKALYMFLLYFTIIMLFEGNYNGAIGLFLSISATILPIVIFQGHSAKAIVVDYLVRFLECEPL